jgi:hypothetical protein
MSENKTTKLLAVVGGGWTQVGSGGAAAHPGKYVPPSARVANNQY